MVTYQVLYWQEIPSQVEARDGSQMHKEILSQRFQELIDLVATKRGLIESDSYLTGWTKGDKTNRSGSVADVAKSVAAELEQRYEEIRVAALAIPRV